MSSTRQVKGEKICFVIMPFGEPFDSYYREIFVPTIKRAGLKPIRADEIHQPGVIINQVWENIKQATVLVAEVTDQNPNVMYELGLAHAINKPVVQIIKNDAKNVPFDLRSLRHIVYNTERPNWSEELSSKLEDFLQNAIENPGPLLPFKPIEPDIDEEKKEHGDLKALTILLSFVPSEATDRMKSVYTKVYSSYRNLDREECFNKITELAQEKIDSLRLEASSSSRDVEKSQKEAIAKRMENMLSEFTMRFSTNKSKDPLNIFREVIEEWKTIKNIDKLTESVKELDKALKG